MLILEMEVLFGPIGRETIVEGNCAVARREGSRKQSWELTNRNRISGRCGGATRHWTGTPESQADTRTVNPAATERRISVLPWDSYFLEVQITPKIGISIQLQRLGSSSRTNELRLTAGKLQYKPSFGPNPDCERGGSCKKNATELHRQHLPIRAVTLIRNPGRQKCKNADEE